MWRFLILGLVEHVKWLEKARGLKNDLSVGILEWGIDSAKYMVSEKRNAKVWNMSTKESKRTLMSTKKQRKKRKEKWIDITKFELRLC